MRCSSSPTSRASASSRVLPVFLERLALQPQRELARICRFLGHDGPVVWRDDLDRRNASSRRLRETSWRSALERYPAARRALRSVVPAPLRRQLNRPWQITRRPQLQAGPRRALEAIFDADLRVLGSWLGLELSCARFQEVARSDRPLDFRARPPGA